jgi:hypothetical protein
LRDGRRRRTIEIVPTPTHDEDQAAPLKRQRRARRRSSSVFFFGAGILFGTALYLLRARFATLAEPRHRVAFCALVLVMVLLFWLGARAEAEVSTLDEKLRELRETAARRRQPPRA